MFLFFNPLGNFREDSYSITIAECKCTKNIFSPKVSIWYCEVDKFLRVQSLGYSKKFKGKYCCRTE